MNITPDQKSEEGNSAVMIIRERPEAQIRENYTRAMNEIYKFIEEEGLDRGYIDSKKGLFESYYKKFLFSRVIHTSSEDIKPDTDGQVTLKSPEKLGGKYTNSGDSDVFIGNTYYIFCSFALMRTALAGGSFEYQVNPNPNDFVVPMDIHDLATLNNQDLSYRIYSKNIFYFEDFISYFSLYMATLFNSPLQAIIVMYSIHGMRILDRARIWDSIDTDNESDWGSSFVDYLSDPHHEFEENLLGILKKIKKLLLDYQLMPVASPEIQIKDQVIATPYK